MSAIKVTATWISLWNLILIQYAYTKYMLNETNHTNKCNWKYSIKLYFSVNKKHYQFNEKCHFLNISDKMLSPYRQKAFQTLLIWLPVTDFFSKLQIDTKFTVPMLSFPFWFPLLASGLVIWAHVVNSIAHLLIPSPKQNNSVHLYYQELCNYWFLIQTEIDLQCIQQSELLRTKDEFCIVPKDFRLV